MCLPVKPYKIEREWKSKGLSCVVTLPREHGHRCGYVRVPPGHPAHGKDYDTEPTVDLLVHGGPTFTQIEPCTEHEDGQGWWIGFDCGHAFDKYDEPGYEPTEFSLLHVGDHYWTEDEVATECEQLAEQLVGMEFAEAYAVHVVSSKPPVDRLLKQLEE
jgi:hypothetical protein